MKNPSFLLVSDTTKSYTSLHEYDRKKQMFQGEYSLIHNRFSYDHVFLSKFLLLNEGNPLSLISSQNTEYFEIRNNYDRFLENDVSKYIGEQVEKEKYIQNNHLIDKGLGQLQLMILKGLVESRLKTVGAISSQPDVDNRKILGRELELEWVMEKIDELIQKGNPNA